MTDTDALIELLGKCAFRDPLARRTIRDIAPDLAREVIALRAEIARVRGVGDEVAERVADRITSEFRGFWAPEDLVEDIPPLIREEFASPHPHHWR